MAIGWTKRYRPMTLQTKLYVFFVVPLVALMMLVVALMTWQQIRHSHSAAVEATKEIVRVLHSDIETALATPGGDAEAYLLAHCSSIQDIQRLYVFNKADKVIFTYPAKAAASEWLLLTALRKTECFGSKLRIWATPPFVTNTTTQSMSKYPAHGYRET